MNLQWLRGLYCVTLHLFLYGVINYAIFAVSLLFQSPSAISLFIAFPLHAASVTAESGLAIIFAFILLVSYPLESPIIQSDESKPNPFLGFQAGIEFRKPKTVLTVAWLLLSGYLVAVGYIIAIVYEGQLVVDALVYVYYGKQYPADSSVKTPEYIMSEVGYYTYLMIHLFLLLLLSTYATMMTLTYYEGLLQEKNSVTMV